MERSAHSARRARILPWGWGWRSAVLGDRRGDRIGGRRRVRRGWRAPLRGRIRSLREWRLRLFRLLARGLLDLSSARDEGRGDEEQAEKRRGDLHSYPDGAELMPSMRGLYFRCFVIGDPDRRHRHCANSLCQMAGGGCVARAGSARINHGPGADEANAVVVASGPAPSLSSWRWPRAPSQPRESTAPLRSEPIAEDPRRTFDAAVKPRL